MSIKEEPYVKNIHIEDVATIRSPRLSLSQRASWEFRRLLKPSGVDSRSVHAISLPGHFPRVSESQRSVHVPTLRLGDRSCD